MGGGLIEASRGAVQPMVKRVRIGKRRLIPNPDDPRSLAPFHVAKREGQPGRWRMLQPDLVSHRLHLPQDVAADVRLQPRSLHEVHAHPGRAAPPYTKSG